MDNIETLIIIIGTISVWGWYILFQLEKLKQNVAILQRIEKARDLVEEMDATSDWSPTADIPSEFLDEKEYNA